MKSFRVMLLLLLLVSVPCFADEVEVSKKDDVANSKSMDTKVHMYADGKVQVTCKSRSQHNTQGLRGRILLIYVDGQGRAIWVSQVYSCTTRGSKFDPSTPNSGTDSFPDSVPAVVAAQVKRIDINNYEGKGPSRDEWVANVKKTVKDAGDISQEIKTEVEKLQ